MRALAAGAPVCVSVTHLDGLVYARSAFESSMRYRSATVLGTATEVAADEKLHALEVLTEHLLPGRWAELRAPRAKELAATSVLRVPLDEWSVKVGDGFPEDPDEDLDEPVWAGVVPMRVAYDDPVDAPDLGPDRPVPAHVRRFETGARTPLAVAGGTGQRPTAQDDLVGGETRSDELPPARGVEATGGVGGIGGRHQEPAVVRQPGGDCVQQQPAGAAAARDLAYAERHELEVPTEPGLGELRRPGLGHPIGPPLAVLAGEAVGEAHEVRTVAHAREPEARPRRRGGPTCRRAMQRGRGSRRTPRRRPATPPRRPRRSRT